MAQAIIDQRNKRIATRSIGVGTDSDEVLISATLPNRKVVKMYFSSVYQDRVLSLNIAEAKSFIMDRINWNHFKQLIPSIDQFFEQQIFYKNGQKNDC
jgi:hypothetical protein